MKGLICLIGLFGLFSMSTAITQSQIDQLLDLNKMFDFLHKEYDELIKKSWDQQKHNMKVLNAQFLSRYSFTVEEIKDKEFEVLEAADHLEEKIGSNECIQTVRSEVENAIEYANSHMSATVQEIFVHFNETNDGFFYPDVEILHFQSNSFQWEILVALIDINPVADMDGLIQKLMRDYYIILEMFEEATESLQNGIRAYDRQFNSARRTAFATFQNTLNYFLFTMTLIEDSLNDCI